MKTLYTNLDIQFTVENTRFHASNIVFERFLRTIPNHSHGARSYEIHYIPDGFGKAKINHRYYDIKPNTLYVTGPHVEHFHVPDPQNPMCEYCVYIKIDSGRKKEPEHPSDSVVWCFQQYPFWFGQDTQNIHALMQKLFSELEHQYLGYKEEVQALLCQLVVSMVRNYRQVYRSSSHFAGSSISDSKSLITEEYFLYEYQQLSLEDLSDRLGLSPRQTERYLKEQYGKTFLQKKTESRMSTAAILLSDPSRSITSVAEELGYSSVEHFSTAFRRYYGCSPRKYRYQLNAPDGRAPFTPVSQERVLSDLAESRQQIADGQGLDMKNALNRMGKQHGFI